MEWLETPLQCSLCLAGISQERWTRHFYTVFIDNNCINTGSVICNMPVQYSARLQMTVSQQRETKTIKVLNTDASVTSSNLFLIHLSCVELLQKLTQNTTPTRLFKLCQSLQPDRSRHFGFESASSAQDCLSPICPPLPVASAEKYYIQASNIGGRLILPPEIVMAILQYLSARTLISFFCASKTTLSYAYLFCKHHPWHFYPFIDLDVICSEVDIQAKITAIFNEFSEDEYTKLDGRWNILPHMMSMAKCIDSISEKWPLSPTQDTRAPLLLVPHVFGFRQLTANIPDEIDTIEVHTRVIRDSVYVCGLGWKSGLKEVVFGDNSECRTSIDIQCRTLHFITDSLGIRSLRFGKSRWSSDQSKDTNSWEGVSFKPRWTSKVSIIADSLKFRQIAWSSSDPRLFEETLVIRKQHGLKFGCISEENYIKEYPEHEAALLERFGNFAVESLSLDEGISGITMYCDSGTTGIVGARIHSALDVQTVGRTNALAKYFPVYGPAEMVSEVDVRTSDQPIQIRTPAIMIRTNWNRQCLFGCLPLSQVTYTAKTLRPPRGHFIKSFYFRMSNRSIESFGITCTSGSRGTPCPVILPVLRCPLIKSTYEAENSSQFESCARLSHIKRASFYYDNGRYIGLRLFYHFGGSDVIGRVQKYAHRETTFSEDESIHRVWIAYKDEKVSKIHLQTKNSGALNQSENECNEYDEYDEYTVTGSMAIAWWYSETRDIIRVFTETY